MRARDGVATIEFVVVVPILLVLLGAILTVGHAGSARIAALGAARDGAWANEPNTDPGDVLSLNHNPDVSRAEYQAREPFRAFPPLNRREWSATARTETHFKTWTDDDLVVTGARPTSDPWSSGLPALLAAHNHDTLPYAAAALAALSGLRFLAP